MRRTAELPIRAKAADLVTNENIPDVYAPHPIGPWHFRFGATACAVQIHTLV